MADTIKHSAITGAEPPTDQGLSNQPLSIGATAQQRVRRREQGSELDALDQIAEERPIALIYNGLSHVVMMASPTDLEDFARGFSLSEGIIQHPNEIYAVEAVNSNIEQTSGVELHIEISSQRFAALKQQRRNLTGRTGCGLCGAESLAQAIRPIPQQRFQALPDESAVEQSLQQLQANQPLQSLTGACHGAAWCDLNGEIIALREDVGRHNALDKLLGYLSLTGIDKREGFLLISSRASYEMISKAAHCGISSLVAVSAPTQLAIDQARQANMNLIGFARPGRHVIYQESQPHQPSQEQEPS